MLDSRRVLTFCEVVRHQSFSAAAAALSLTQPAVSQQIRALELQLGGRLIERRRGVFKLTAAGELLFEHADALSQRLQLAETQLAETLAATTARLRLGAFPSALAALVPNATRSLRAHTAELELSVVEGHTMEFVEQIRRGDLHIALGFADADDQPPEQPGTCRHDLFVEAMRPVLGPTHPLASRSAIRLSDLRDDTWLAAANDGLIHRACVAAGFAPRIRYLTGDPLAIRGLVAAGLAVTLTPQLLATEMGALHMPTLIGGEPRRLVYALTPSVGAHPLAEPFLDALREEAHRLGLHRL